MLSVIYAESRKKALNAECNYAECRYAECRGALMKAYRGQLWKGKQNGNSEDVKWKKDQGCEMLNDY